MAALVDTNLLVYRFDSSALIKQKIARELLRSGIAHDSLRVPHQAILEFVAAVTKPRQSKPVLLSRHDAGIEAEQLLDQFVVLHPNAPLVRTALRGATAYQVTW